MACKCPSSKSKISKSLKEEQTAQKDESSLKSSK